MNNALLPRYLIRAALKHRVGVMTLPSGLFVTYEPGTLEPWANGYVTQTARAALSRVRRVVADRKAGYSVTGTVLT